jgi:hypothetical protein
VPETIRTTLSLLFTGNGNAQVLLYCLYQLFRLFVPRQAFSSILSRCVQNCALGNPQACLERGFGRDERLPKVDVDSELDSGTAQAPWLRASIFEMNSRVTSEHWRALPHYSLCLILLCALSSGGCSWTNKSGTHYLIVGIGFGVITTTNRPGIDVFNTRIAGMAIAPSGVDLGLMNRHRVEIDPVFASNVVLSVKLSTGNLTIKNYAVESNVSQSDKQIASNRTP